MQKFLGGIYSDLDNVSLVIERILQSEFLSEELDPELKVIIMALRSIQDKVELKASLIEGVENNG